MAETRKIYYDNYLGLEAYHLGGIVQEFPNHFHSFFVLGFIEGGKRHLWCKGEEYDLAQGDMVLFNPKDSHHCAPIGSELLDYRAINIPAPRMRHFWNEVTGLDGAPHFQRNVVKQSPLTDGIRCLYDSIVNRTPELEREEACYWLLERLFQDYTAREAVPEHQGSPEMNRLCSYIEANYSTNITLNDMAKAAMMSKTGLLRLFTKEKGVTPYRYLQSVRIQRAKELLEQQMPLPDAAYAAGFSDQSHFTNYFKEFTGVTPGQYQRIFQISEKGEQRHAEK